MGFQLCYRERVKERYFHFVDEIIVSCGLQA